MKFYPGLAVAMLLSSTVATHAQSLPSYMAPISGQTTATPADIATKDMLALNTGMFELYGDAGKIFQANILAKHPVILSLFSASDYSLTVMRIGLGEMAVGYVWIVYLVARRDLQEGLLCLFGTPWYLTRKKYARYSR